PGRGWSCRNRNRRRGRRWFRWECRRKLRAKCRGGGAGVSRDRGLRAAARAAFVLFYGFCRVLWPRTQLGPFGVAGERHTLAADARYQMHVSVEGEIVARRGIDKAGIETFDRGGCRDAPAELADRVPDHVLLLDVEVEEGGDMSARRDNQVAGGEWAGMRYGHHKLREHPGVLGCRGTERAGGQANTIPYVLPGRGGVRWRDMVFHVHMSSQIDAAPSSSPLALRPGDPDRHRRLDDHARRGLPRSARILREAQQELQNAAGAEGFLRSHVRILPEPLSHALFCAAHRLPPAARRLARP